MGKLTGKVIVITGGGSGVGKATAKLCLDAGAKVVIAGRDAAKLMDVAEEFGAGENLYGIPTDVTDAEQCQNLMDSATSHFGRVDVLVNNAGYGTIGPFEAANEDDVAGVVRLNAEALTVLARRFAPSMGPGGGILNVASTAAFQPLPYFAVYAATKAYVLNFSEALHAELKPRGVHVTCLCPGPTKTAFGVRAGMAPAFFKGGQTSERVAAVGLRALARNRRVAVSGAGNAVGAFFGRIAPRGPLLAAMGPVFARMHRPS